MTRTGVLLIVTLGAAAAGCAPPPGPEQALAQVEAAVTRGDVAALRARLSGGTVSHLRRRFGEGQADAAAAFMMHRLKSGAPFRAAGRRQEGGAVFLKVRRADARAARWEGELKFVREGGGWKLDLVGDFKAWEGLAEWARRAEENMRRATPLLGQEGPPARPSPRGPAPPDP